MIERVPITLYYDSYRAALKDRTLSGQWQTKGLHRIMYVNTVNGATSYSIAHPTGGYGIGWVRHDDITDPYTIEPDPEEPPIEEPEIIEPDATIEKDGEVHNLFYGSNADKELVLQPGINRIKVKGKGTVRFHWRNEVMG